MGTKLLQILGISHPRPWSFLRLPRTSTGYQELCSRYWYERVHAAAGQTTSWRTARVSLTASLKTRAGTLKTSTSAPRLLVPFRPTFTPEHSFPLPARMLASHYETVLAHRGGVPKRGRLAPAPFPATFITTPQRRLPLAFRPSSSSATLCSPRTVCSVG